MPVPYAAARKQRRVEDNPEIRFYHHGNYVHLFTLRMPGITPLSHLAD